jgi:uncharacterized protein (DUF488 family)
MAHKHQVYTIGHSTHTTREFIKILKAYDIELLIDVRHYPGSRHVPQFGKARLRKNLLRHGIDYLHLENLGGRRSLLKDSHLNDGWRSEQFRGYADYMQTQAFKEGLEELMKLARKRNVAILCAEAVPWRCHRSMIGDALLVHSFVVIDIFTQKNARLHNLTSFAKIKQKQITYPISE